MTADARSRFGIAVAASALWLAACGGYGTAMPPGATGPGAAGATGGGADAAAGAATLPEPTATPNFQPRPEFTGPCEQRPNGAVDVNLGNSPEGFVRAAYCQATGAEPPADAVTRFAGLLRTDERTRRIDVVRQICAAAAARCTPTYSNPWQADIPLAPVCTRKTTRDLGAVLMFFSDCPNGVNCNMDWANTHAHGMNSAHPIYGFGAAPANYYNPRNAGYWHRQLLDARWAGLQFFLLNTYGPDIGGAPDQLKLLGEALKAAGPGGVKVALFDDPWAWGKDTTPAYRTAPNMSDTEGAAQAIYQAKWKPFYTRVEQQYWYLLQNRPFIYFYNAGTLKPLNVSAAVVARLKQLFTADFGVTPFVAVDTAYFQDPAMRGVADSEFRWATLGSGPTSASATTSRTTMNGVTLEHFMVKWDSVGRDHAGMLPLATDKLIKGTNVLADRLEGSKDANVAVIATWNDLGEGTGIERNYDYYLGGAWSPPTTFMSLTRSAQCSD